MRDLYRLIGKLTDMPFCFTLSCQLQIPSWIRSLSRPLYCRVPIFEQRLTNRDTRNRVRKECQINAKQWNTLYPVSGIVIILWAGRESNMDLQVRSSTRPQYIWMAICDSSRAQYANRHIRSYRLQIRVASLTFLAVTSILWNKYRVYWINFAQSLDVLTVLLNEAHGRAPRPPLFIASTACIILKGVNKSFLNYQLCCWVYEVRDQVTRMGSVMLGSWWLSETWGVQWLEYDQFI
jgi:hypothetical protein